MANEIDGKALLMSKQFWLMVMAILVDVLMSDAVLKLIPNYVAIAGAVVAVLSIVIRYVTDMPITRIV